MQQIIDILVRDYGSIPVTSIKASVPVNWALMNAETLAHLIAHGAKQKANDPNGAKDLSESEKLGNSQKVLANLEKNEVRATAERLDPREAEIMRLAVAAVSDKIIAKDGVKALRAYKLADLRKRAQEAMDKFPAFKTRIESDADANLAKKAELAGMVEFDDEPETHPGD